MTTWRFIPPVRMADTLTPEQRHLNMSRIRSADTKPEMLIRRMLHGRGFRYRLHRSALPGTPDIVLPRYNAVVMIHGCFWHGHRCHLFSLPKTHTEFWAGKIAVNQERDQKAEYDLRKLGWRVACIWECALRGRKKQDRVFVTDKLSEFVNSAENRLEIYGRRSDS